MAFSWPSFLDQNRIEYVERGPNVAHGNIAINCPFCGDDPSHHLGLSLTNGFWGCFRNERHRGRNPTRLIQALLGCSRFQAEAIAGFNKAPPLDDFDKVIASLTETVTTEEKIDHIVFPPNVKTLVDKGMGRLFIDYLVSRDYTRDEAKHLCEIYWMMYATVGTFASRIIIPIEMPQGLVTWTGRDITGTSDARYKTLSKEESVFSIKHTLFGFKSLMEDVDSETVIVCEGPFDAIRIDFFGYPFGIRATCLFGLQATDSQVNLLSQLASRYKNRYIALDAGAGALQLALQSKLDWLDYKSLTIPEPYKDPGELPKTILKSWFTAIQEQNNMCS